jgi:hypothetical protein
MKKVLAVAIIAILFISTYAVLTQMTNAQPSATSIPNMSIQPSQKSAALGVPFSVDVVVSGITSDQGVKGIQFRVKYDSNMLQATNVTEGPFMKDSRWNKHGTVFLSPIDDDFNAYGGNVLVGDLLLPDDNGVWAAFPNGTGTVATITFITSKAFPQSKVLPTMTQLTIVDNLIVNDKPVPSTVTNGTVQIGRIAFDLQPSPVQVALGEQFSVDVVVSGVDLDERVTGMQFRVKYDSNMLQATKVTEGPFMKDSRWNKHGTVFLSPIDDDFNAYGGNVLVGDLLLPDDNGVWAAFPNGTGTVATITFSTVARPKYVPTTTQLTIVNNLVVNDNAPTPREVPSSVSSEAVQIDLPPPATLSIYPGQLYAVLGHPLVVSVMINNLKAGWRTVGVQFSLCYDPTLFEVVSVSEGSFMKDKRWNLHGTYFLNSTEVDPVYGPCVLIGDLLIPDDNGEWAAVASGFGVLATVTLNPIHAAGINDPPLTTTLSIKNDLIVNDANEEIGEVLHTANGAEVTILPIRPTLSVDPPLVEAHGVGTTFSVNVDVSELNVGWRAIALQFRLMYDTKYLEVVSVTEGSFMKDSRWNLHGTYFIDIVEVDPVYGPCVLIGDLLIPDDNGNWAAFPTGSGTVATVTFNVTSLPRGLDQPPTHVNLGLADPFSILVNDNQEEITTNLLSGEVRIYPTHIADVNRDGKVNMRDIGYVALAFGAKPGHPRWNADYDIVIDDVINMRDIGVAARNFGWQSI